MRVSITLPILFVVLWSSAFVTGKIIVIDASPSTALALRFGVVTLGFLAYVFIRGEQLWVGRRGFAEACFTGVLFHGLYLTGIFHAVLNGVPAGSVALIVCLQPLITGALAGYLFSEIVTSRQWFGLFLGFLGTVFVVDSSVGDFSYSVGLMWAFVGLVAVTSATLLQKKFSGRIPLSTNNFYQAGAATVFHLIILATVEPITAEHVYFPCLSDRVANLGGVLWRVQYFDVLACPELCQSDRCLALPGTTTGGLFQLAHSGRRAFVNRFVRFPDC